MAVTLPGIPLYFASHRSLNSSCSAGDGVCLFSGSKCTLHQLQEMAVYTVGSKQQAIFQVVQQYASCLAGR